MKTLARETISDVLSIRRSPRAVETDVSAQIDLSKPVLLALSCCPARRRASVDSTDIKTL